METANDAARLAPSEAAPTWEEAKAQRLEKREQRKDQQWADARSWHDAMSREPNPGLPKR